MIQYPKKLLEDVFYGRHFKVVDNSEKILENIIDTSGMTPEEKIAIILKYKEGYTVKQIAEEINTTHDRARGVIDRGLRKLKHPKNTIRLRKIIIE